MAMFDTSHAGRVGHRLYCVPGIDTGSACCGIPMLAHALPGPSPTARHRPPHARPAGRGCPGHGIRVVRTLRCRGALGGPVPYSVVARARGGRVGGGRLTLHSMYVVVVGRFVIAQ